MNSSIPLQLPAPQAIPGLAQEVYEQTLVTLDGTQSYDPDGYIAAWQWSQIAGPAVSIESPNMPVTLFRAPQVPPGGADLRFRLDVRDDAGNSSAGTVDVHVFDQRDRRDLLIWRSPPGEYIGGGVPLTFTPKDGDVVVGTGGTAAQVAFRGDGFNSWSLLFVPPQSALLTPGTYVVPGPGAPNLDVYGSGRGCSATAGQYTVLEIDNPNAPAQFAVRFVQSCDSGPALRGTVLVNAIAPGNPVARIVDPTFATPGAIVTLDGSGSSSTGSNVVSYKWRQLSGPTVTVDDPTSPKITFARPASTASSAVRFELEIDDEDGLVDVAQITATGGATVPASIPIIDRGLAWILALALGLAAWPYVRRHSR